MNCPVQGCITEASAGGLCPPHRLWELSAAISGLWANQEDEREYFNTQGKEWLEEKAREKALSDQIQRRWRSKKNAMRGKVNTDATEKARDIIQLILDSQDYGRNNALNEAAFDFGRMVAGLEWGEADAYAALARAAGAVGLRKGEFEATIQSGLTAGKMNGSPITFG